MNDAWILDAVRTPRGRGKAEVGKLSDIHPQELAAQALAATTKRTSIQPEDIDDVILGCVSQVGEQGACIARNAVLSAGLPESVTGTTVNRFCGSGLQAINFGAQAIGASQQHVVIAGGVESMSRVPLGSDQGGIDGNNPYLRKSIHQVPQGISADLIATKEKISRETLDAFALRSQKNAAQAIEENRFDKSLIPVYDPFSQTLVLEKDEHPRPKTTSQALASLQPVFEKFGKHKLDDTGLTYDAIAEARYPKAGSIQHLHTAGNSSGIVDGASTVMLSSQHYAKAHGLKPRARIRATATFGTEPIIMLTAPAPASQRALQLAGMQASDIDLWEINEAFAVVPIQTMRTLEIPEDRVNVNGGAIALGHPLGATGAILIGTLLDELERQDLHTGLATLCIGGGMGIATIIERI